MNPGGSINIQASKVSPSWPLVRVDTLTIIGLPDDDEVLAWAGAAVLPFVAVFWEAARVEAVPVPLWLTPVLVLDIVYMKLLKRAAACWLGQFEKLAVVAAVQEPTPPVVSRSSARGGVVLFGAICGTQQAWLPLAPQLFRPFGSWRTALPAVIRFSVHSEFGSGYGFGHVRGPAPKGLCSQPA